MRGCWWGEDLLFCFVGCRVCFVESVRGCVSGRIRGCVRGCDS